MDYVGIKDYPYYSVNHENFPSEVRDGWNPPQAPKERKKNISSSLFYILRDLCRHAVL